ncbi:MAG: dihydrofolate reductase [Haliangiales bacterium]
MSGARFDIVVAADQDRGIARAGEIPWHIPADLRHFKRVTTAGAAAASASAVEADPGAVCNAVIMGRLTWESLPARVRPLPGRVNVVLSRGGASGLPHGVVQAADLDAALSVESVGAVRLARRFVIGGAQVYAAAVAHPGCRHIFYTRVAARFGCDRFFPELPGDFVLAEESAAGEHDGLGYGFERWTRAGS